MPTKSFSKLSCQEAEEIASEILMTSFSEEEFISRIKDAGFDPKEVFVWTVTAGNDMTWHALANVMGPDGGKIMLSHD